MLVHHDSRSYQEAASEAAAFCRKKMEDEIDRGQSQAAAVLDQVHTQIPQDAIVAGRSMRFQFEKGALRLRSGASELDLTMHRHALQQAASKLELPWKYVEHLQAQGAKDGDGYWGQHLLARNLQDLVVGADLRYLVRSVAGEARGFLSDSYRRLDCRPILDAFCGAMQKIGAVPVSGSALDTKIEIKALLPRVFEPVPNEPMAFGLAFSNSDFGDGAVSVRAFVNRLMCTNKATLEEALRQVHLGGRLADDVAFSQRTYRLDTQRTCSMVRDLVEVELGAKKVETYCARVKAAHEKALEAGEIKGFFNRHLLKGEAEAAAEAYNGADIVNLPPGQTAWRMSNAISWIAGKTENPHRRLELERIAAKALPGGEQN